MKLLTSILLYAALGILLSNMGCTLFTWQYWVILLIVGIIDIKSHIEANSYDKE